MEWTFDIGKLIEEHTYDVVVRDFGMNSGSLIYYTAGGTPRLSTLLKIENKYNVDLTKYIKFKNVVSLGDKIKMYRILGYFTIKELAEELGISKTTVTDWEGDVIVPKKEQALALCDLFGIEKNELMTERWRIQAEIEELNKQVNLIMRQWMQSRNTQNSKLLDQAQELLTQMQVLGTARDLAIKKGSEPSGEEFVY